MRRLMWMKASVGPPVQCWDPRASSMAIKTKRQGNAWQPPLHSQHLCFLVKRLMSAIITNITISDATWKRTRLVFFGMAQNLCWRSVHSMKITGCWYESLAGWFWETFADIGLCVEIVIIWKCDEDSGKSKSARGEKARLVNVLALVLLFSPPFPVMKTWCNAGWPPRSSRRTWNPTKRRQTRKVLHTQITTGVQKSVTFKAWTPRWKIQEWGLTMRKQAPMSTAFIFTSRSSGNWMPKLSVSVKTSFNRPLHCLLMRPMGSSLSLPFSCGATGMFTHVDGKITTTQHKDRVWASS